MKGWFHTDGCSVTRAAPGGDVHPDPDAMTVPTLFIPGLAGHMAGAEVTLSPEETAHARSLRLRCGTEVAVTDGAGHRWLARLASLDRGSAVCVLGREVVVSPALPIRLAFGVGTRDRTLWLIEKAVELGAAGLEPLEFARSASVADAARSAGYWRRARRRAIAALKQSGGSWLPQIRPVAELSAWLSEPTQPGARRLLADETADRGFGAHLDGWDGRSEAILLIGPEGGIEPPERESCLKAGFLAGRLGVNTLRFETAAVAALALVAERSARTEAVRGTGRGSPGCVASASGPAERNGGRG